MTVGKITWLFYNAKQAVPSLLWHDEPVWRPGQVTTMAVPNRNYEIKKNNNLFIGAPFIWLNNL